MKLNDPIGDGALIRDLVARGYIIRTRADADTAQARTGDTTMRDAALASGAQFVSTDYPVPNPAFGTGYFVDLPAKAPPAATPSTRRGTAGGRIWSACTRSGFRLRRRLGKTGGHGRRGRGGAVPPGAARVRRRPAAGGAGAARALRRGPADGRRVLGAHDRGVRLPHPGRPRRVLRGCPPAPAAASRPSPPHQGPGDFGLHVATYLLINVFLVIMWLMGGHGYFWPVWVLVGWGLPLAFHGLWVYGPFTDE